MSTATETLPTTAPAATAAPAAPAGTPAAPYFQYALIPPSEQQLGAPTQGAAASPKQTQRVDASELELAKQQKTQRVMKIVFGIIVCIVIVIVVLSIYSMMTQSCPSTSSSSYTPSLTCAGANVINQVGNTLAWIQTNWLALILVPAGLAMGYALLKAKLTKSNIAENTNKESNNESNNDNKPVPENNNKPIEASQ